MKKDRKEDIPEERIAEAAPEGAPASAEAPVIAAEGEVPAEGSAPAAEAPAEGGISAENAPAKEGKRSKTKRAKGAGQKGKRRKLKCIIAVVTALALCGTGLGIGLLFIPKEGLVVNTDYASVSYEVQEGEIYTPGSEYNGLDIFGRLNWTFQHKKEWYSSYQGYVYTTVNQDVKTFKQFKDGMLISADISTSSLVNVAREFCYIPSADRVIWRESDCAPAEYNGFDTPWETGEPKGNMTISGPDGFKSKNGLPATELIGYIFREETVASADPVEDNGDGTYTITYYMNPEVWKAEDGSSEGAAAYYCNQMKFTGGLTDVPTFDAITISFTFNENWENLKTEIHEKYTATMGFTVGCEADGVTLFSYDTPFLPLTDAYGEYFEQYAQVAPSNDNTGGGPSAMNSLTEAFAPVINGPTTLSLDLTIGGKPVQGAVYVDLGTDGSVPGFETEEEISTFINNLEVRAKIGGLALEVKEGAAYVQAGDLKAKLTVSELMDLFGDLLGGEGSAPAEGEEGEGSDILTDLLGGEFTYDRAAGTANMHSALALGSVTIPIDFNYTIDGETFKAALADVRTEIALLNAKISAKLAYTSAENAPAELADKADFVELASYVKNIADLVTADAFRVALSYEGFGLTLSGDVLLSVKEKTAFADLLLSRGAAPEDQKQFVVGYQDGVVYLSLDGVRLSADGAKGKELIEQFLGNATGSLAGFSFDIPTLLDTLLFTHPITDDLTLSEETSGDLSALKVAVAADSLLGALGVDLKGFSLGTLGLSVKAGELSLSAEEASYAAEGKDPLPLGALHVTLSANEEPITFDKTGYTDATALIGAVQTLASAGYLTADLSYGTEALVEADQAASAPALRVTGKLNIDYSDLSGKGLAAQGTFRIYYGEIDKEIKLGYAQSGLYLTVDGLNLKVEDPSKIVSIVQSILATEDASATEDPAVQSVLDALFSFRFGEVLLAAAGETDGLALTLKADALLAALLPDASLKLGDVVLEIGGNGSVRVTAAGVTASFAVGSPVTVEEAETYSELTPVLEALPALLSAKKLSLTGSVELTLPGAEGAEDTVVSLNIAKGILSWADGLDVYLKAELTVAETCHALYLRIDGSQVQFAYGDYGLTVTYAEMKELESALFNIYGHIYEMLGSMVGEGKNPLPAVSSFSDLLGLLKGSEAVAEGAAAVAGGETFDWTKLVQNIVLSNQNGVLAHAQYGDVSVDLLDETGKDGLIGLTVNYTSEKVRVEGDLGAAVYTGATPAMPEGRYIAGSEVKNLLGFVGSAISLFETTELTLSFEGKVTSNDAVTYPPAEGESAGVKYTIDASMSTHRGKGSLLHLDVEGSNLWVDPEIYAHASINVVAAKPAVDSSLYIDLFILDAAPGQGKESGDGMLDFYVTLSQFGPVGTQTSEVAEYDPVLLYAPADEIMTILSAALPLLGVDVDILNNYMVNKWLSLESVGQLKALGSLVGGLLGGGAKESAEESAEEAAPVALEESAPAPKEIKPSAYIKELVLDEERISVTLDSSAVYGIEGLSDVTATLTKEKDVTAEDGSVTYGAFKTLDLSNIYDRAGTENTTLKGTVTYGGFEDLLPSGTYKSFLGADGLILALAKSATHKVSPAAGEVISGEEAGHTYALNNNFYIDGTANITLTLLGFDAISVEIKIIAISVTIDEDGELGINIRLGYDGVSALFGAVTAINGTSTVDITIKNGMVYMKRVQTTNSKNEAITPETLYRVAPLGNFTADILDHIGFIFNFGSMITNALSSATGSGSASTSAKVDFGKRLSDVLKSYTYTQAAVGGDGSVTTPASWDLTLNGDALVKGVLGDLNVKLAENENGCIRDITATTSIVSIIHATVSLHWRNAGGNMENDVIDQTHDILNEENLTDSASGFGGVIGKMKEQGWGTEDYTGFATFLEGERKTVTFKHNDQILGTQNVMASTGADGNPERTLYSALNYPDVSAPEYAPAEETQVMGWAEVAPGKVLPDGYVISTKAHGYPCTVTFWSDEELGEGWQWQEGEGRWSYTADMYYGAQIVFGADDIVTVNGELSVDVDEHEVPPFEYGGREGKWQKEPVIGAEGATFVAEYTPDTLIYHSTVPYKVTGVVKNVTEHRVEYGTDYTVYTPTANGYTFVGWFEQQADGSWKEVEVGTTYTLGAEHKETTLEALWVSKLSITVTKAEKSNKSGIFPTYYNCAIEATVAGGRLVGVPASEASMTFTYSFDSYTAPALGIGNGNTESIGGGQTLHDFPAEDTVAGSQAKVRNRDKDMARVHIQIVYTLNGVQIYDSETVTATASWLVL